ncbi:MAG: hypothetical protein ACLQFR_07645 [Streptosporangiaceae bacterium]
MKRFLRQAWIRVKYLDQVLLDGFATLRLRPRCYCGQTSTRNCPRHGGRSRNAAAVTARQPWEACWQRRFLNWLLARDAAWAYRSAIREVRRGRLAAAARRVDFERWQKGLR